MKSRRRTTTLFRKEPFQVSKTNRSLSVFSPYQKKKEAAQLLIFKKEKKTSNKSLQAKNTGSRHVTSKAAKVEHAKLTNPKSNHNKPNLRRIPLLPKTPVLTKSISMARSK
jgi:hypothetical protein